MKAQSEQDAKKELVLVGEDTSEHDGGMATHSRLSCCDSCLPSPHAVEQIATGQPAKPANAEYVVHFELSPENLPRPPEPPTGLGGTACSENMGETDQREMRDDRQLSEERLCQLGQSMAEHAGACRVAVDDLDVRGQAGAEKLRDVCECRQAALEEAVADLERTEKDAAKPAATRNDGSQFGRSFEFVNVMDVQSGDDTVFRTHTPSECSGGRGEPAGGPTAHPMHFGCEDGLCLACLAERNRHSEKVLGCPLLPSRVESKVSRSQKMLGRGVSPDVARVSATSTASGSSSRCVSEEECVPLAVRRRGKAKKPKPKPLSRHFLPQRWMRRFPLPLLRAGLARRCVARV